MRRGLGIIFFGQSAAQQFAHSPKYPRQKNPSWLFIFCAAVHLDRRKWKIRIRFFRLIGLVLLLTHNAC